MKQTPPMACCRWWWPECTTAKIADHLRGRWDDQRHHAGLKTWRATRVEVRGWHYYHVDDEVRVAQGETVSIHVVARGAPGACIGRHSAWRGA